MGKGKGAVEKWSFPCKSGFILTSLIGSSYRSALFALVKAKKKLPPGNRVVKNNFFVDKSFFINSIEN
jgi:ribosomal protein L16/L10AE